jgi:hypothetical protein
MRGTIIMWSGDKGVITAGGQRYDFDINHWQGATEPAANMIVEAAVADGRLAGVTPVIEADRAKEKFAAMKGQGSQVAKAVYANVGRDVAIAYGVFLFAALFLDVISAGGILDVSFKLTNLLSENMGIMGKGRGIFLVLLASATIAVPYFWKHKFASLAFTVPLIFTIMAFWPFYVQHRQQQQAMEAMSEFGRMFGEMAGQMDGGGGGVFDSIGLGAWVVIASALYLAFKGVMKCLGRA